MEEKNKCPNCGAEERQMKMGFTNAGSQRWQCGKCRRTYTPNPRKWEYTAEERKRALKMATDGNTGRAIGRQLEMSKANAYRWAREAAKKGTL